MPRSNISRVPITKEGRLDSYSDRTVHRCQALATVKQRDTLPLSFTAIIVPPPTPVSVASHSSKRLLNPPSIPSVAQLAPPYLPSCDPPPSAPGRSPLTLIVHAATEEQTRRSKELGGVSPSNRACRSCRMSHCLENDGVHLSEAPLAASRVLRRWDLIRNLELLRLPRRQRSYAGRL